MYSDKTIKEPPGVPASQNLQNCIGNKVLH